MTLNGEPYGQSVESGTIDLTNVVVVPNVTDFEDNTVVLSSPPLLPPNTEGLTYQILEFYIKLDKDAFKQWLGLS